MILSINLEKKYRFNNFITSRTIVHISTCIVLVLTPDHYADFAVILSSCEDVISAEVPVYLEKIGKMIRDHFDGEEFCKLNASEGVQWINQNKLIKDVFNDFLSKHGHRSLNEVTISSKI